MATSVFGSKDEVKDDDYIPIAYKLPDLDKDIFDKEINPTFTSSLDYPKFALGFQYYIHQTKDKMEIVNNFEGKKRVYYVLSKFEKSVDDYNKDIDNISKEYFDTKTKPQILSRAFFKLWEIFMMLDLVPTDTSNFISAHLAEGPGSFIQAAMFYREKFVKKGATYKNDKYYAVTLHADTEMKKHLPELDVKFTNFYEKEKPQRFFLHKTFPTEQSRNNPERDNGDLTNPKTIRNFSRQFVNQKAQLVTADGGFEWKNENLQEQEAFKLILAEIVVALKIQAKGGHFVCKLFETFTETTVKLIAVMHTFYKDVYIIKPFMSRKSNSEKYVVGVNYKFGESKEKDEKIKMFEDILVEAFKDPSKRILDIFPDFKLPEDYKNTIIKMNTTIANRQYSNINEMITFIEKQNYHGDVYQERRKMQIEASDFWTGLFYPEVANFDKRHKEIMNSTQALIEENKKTVEKLQSKIEKN